MCLYCGIWSKACHRNYTSLQGRIVSNTLDTCETDITVPENYTIALFFGRFNIYPTTYPFVCNDEGDKPLKVFIKNSRFCPLYKLLDFNWCFKIFDGNQIATSICAQTVPSPFFSNTSHVTLKFKKIDASYSSYDITYLATDQGRGCGGELFNYGGQFSSPLYPSVERNYADCRWTIEVPQNLVVALKFDGIHITLL